MNPALMMFIGGIGLALVAAGLMVGTDGPIAVPITLLIVGIVLIARSRRFAEED